MHDEDEGRQIADERRRSLRESHFDVIVCSYLGRTAKGMADSRGNEPCASVEVRTCRQTSGHASRVDSRANDRGSRDLAIRGKGDAWEISTGMHDSVNNIPPLSLFLWISWAVYVKKGSLFMCAGITRKFDLFVIFIQSLSSSSNWDFFSVYVMNIKKHMNHS